MFGTKCKGFKCLGVSVRGLSVGTKCKMFKFPVHKVFCS